MYVTTIMWWVHPGTWSTIHHYPLDVGTKQLTWLFYGLIIYVQKFLMEKTSVETCTEVIWLGRDHAGDTNQRQSGHPNGYFGRSMYYLVSHVLRWFLLYCCTFWQGLPCFFRSICFLFFYRTSSFLGIPFVQSYPIPLIYREDDWIFYLELSTCFRSIRACNPVLKVDCWATLKRMSICSLIFSSFTESK